MSVIAPLPSGPVVCPHCGHSNTGYLDGQQICLEDSCGQTFVPSDATTLTFEPPAPAAEIGHFLEVLSDQVAGAAVARIEVTPALGCNYGSDLQDLDEALKNLRLRRELIDEQIERVSAERRLLAGQH